MKITKERTCSSRDNKKHTLKIITKQNDEEEGERYKNIIKTNCNIHAEYLEEEKQNIKQRNEVYK
jgi:hypothetical protein